MFYIMFYIPLRHAIIVQSLKRTEVCFHFMTVNILAQECHPLCQMFHQMLLVVRFLILCINIWRALHRAPPELFPTMQSF